MQLLDSHFDKIKIKLNKKTFELDDFLAYFMCYVGRNFQTMVPT
jgi:hypothetical protein